MKQRRESEHAAQLVNECHASSIPQSNFIFFLIIGVIPEKKRRKCDLDQEIKFSWIVSSSVAGIVPICTGLVHRDHVFCKSEKTQCSKRRGQLGSNDLHEITSSCMLHGLNTVINNMWPSIHVHRMRE